MKFYDNEFEFEVEPGEFETQFSVVDKDTFTAAEEGACCLNFASHKRPGGGYKAVMDRKGPIRTQEEDLFRRSNLPELMDTKTVREHYPLKGLQALYCPSIRVSKDKVLNPIEPFNVSLVTVPAVVNPQEEHEELVKGKVKRIFQIAADNQQTTLILGAWGCGIFNNDPDTIAGLFKDELDGDFKGVFEKVIFAVPGKDHPNHRAFLQLYNAPI